MSNTSNQSNSSSGRSRKKRKKAPGKKKFDAVAFWGTAESVPTPDGFDSTTPDSVAVVNSLGQPPLPGHGAASPHYFKLVYDRSTQLASALAMAGGIDDLSPEEAPEVLNGSIYSDDDEDEDEDDENLAEVSSDEDPSPNAKIDESE